MNGNNKYRIIIIIIIILDDGIYSLPSNQNRVGQAKDTIKEHGRARDGFLIINTFFPLCLLGISPFIFMGIW